MALHKMLIAMTLVENFNPHNETGKTTELIHSSISTADLLSVILR